jgi:two-component system OmpR family response regulator
MSQDPRSETTRHTILVVDDDALVRWALSAELDPLYDVRSVATIREARACVAPGEPVDAVVLDIGLPDGSGLTFLRELAKARPEVAALVLSGHSGIHDQARAAGAAFMSKPFRVAEVSGRLETLLRAAGKLT